MSTIQLRNLTKSFGKLAAVKSVDLDVAAGEVVCLLGPSGCGKTTTLRLIAGLERATSGEVHIGGKRVDGLSPSHRNVAMVFQFYALYPTLTVKENLAYPLHAEGIGHAEIEKRIAETSRTLHLDEVLDRRPGQLAEGEKQRVAVGRAIVRDPSCFLFDEPLSRLDVQLREEMRSQIKEVLSGLAKATVIVTHDQLEALTMADRIAVMRDGVIEQIDTPHGIFATPASLFVAGFIGTPQMNLVQATLTDASNGRARFQIGARSVAIQVAPGISRLKPGSAVTLGMRPRNVDLVDQPGEDTIPAKIDLVEPMGAETLLHLVDEQRELRVVVDHRVRAEVGTAAHLRFRPGQVHVFDSSERRVQ
jgi:multiple sugar transport system ATP-binding protein